MTNDLHHAPMEPVTIRPLESGDAAGWQTLYQALFDDVTPADAREDFDFHLASKDAAALVAADGAGRVIGFVLVEMRSYAEGCGRGPVPYIECWGVDPAHRRRGIGGMLLRAAEAWAVGRGYTQIASDCLLDNTVSLRAHRALGYEEVERAIHFRKALPGHG